MVVAFDVENQVREAGQPPSAKAWQVQLVGVARRSGTRMAAQVSKGLLDGIDPCQRGPFSAFAEAVGDGVVDIPQGLLARDDRLDFQARAPVFTALRIRLRSPSKYIESTGPAGADAAPTTKSSRSRCRS
jgi:hypothetical protein